MKRTFIVFACFLSVQASENAHVHEWVGRYYLNDGNLFHQDVLQGIATFIAYVAIKDPTSEHLGVESERILKQYPRAPHELRLALVNLFEQSAFRAHKKFDAQVQGQPVNAQQRRLAKRKLMKLWKDELHKYYLAIYQMLKEEHRFFAYGDYKGSVLYFA